MINKYEISKNDLDQDIENIKGRYNAIIDYLFYIENCLIDSNKESWELEKELNQVKEENKKLKKELSDLEIKNHKLIKEIDYLNDYINDLEKYN